MSCISRGMIWVPARWHCIEFHLRTCHGTSILSLAVKLCVLNDMKIGITGFTPSRYCDFVLNQNACEYGREFMETTDSLIPGSSNSPFPSPLYFVVNFFIVCHSRIVLNSIHSQTHFTSTNCSISIAS